MAESNSQAREQFEAWIKKRFYPVVVDLSRIEDEYPNRFTRVRWDTWQAATSSISAERDALRRALSDVHAKVGRAWDYGFTAAKVAEILLTIDAALQGTRIAREAGL